MASPPVPRAVRVGTEVAHVLAALIEREYADPRLRFVTVTAVRMSRDLKHARVMVSSADPGTDADAALGALRHAGTRLRHGLAGRIRLRSIPRLTFEWDSRGEDYQRLESLIARGLPPAEGADG